MPIKLSDITAATKTLDIPIGDDKITVEYKVNFYTPEFEAKGRAAGEPAAGVALALENALVSWDITDDRGKSLPPTRENLDRIGVGILDKILSALVEDVFPNARRGSNSSD